MAALRVVFDSNAFQPGTFELLEQSSMLRHCRSGRIIPIYSHVFIEETLRAYGSLRRRDDLVRRWLPFIAASTDRLCNDFLTIWHEELVQGRGVRARIFMSERDRELLVSRLPNIPLDGSWRAWHSAQAEIAREDTKRSTQRKISAQMREQVADWRKATRYRPKRHGMPPIHVLFENEVDLTGREFAMALIKAHNPREVASRWARAKQAYPFFTMFVVNMVYMAHYSMLQANQPIDLNAQADLDLMTHLLHADILVSNEQGFLKQAFTDLWRPRRKVLMTSEAFVRFLCKL